MKTHTHTLAEHDESFQPHGDHLFSEHTHNLAMNALPIAALSILLVATAFVVQNASVVKTQPVHFLARVTH